MVLRKRLAMILAASAISATALVGCTSTGGTSTGGGEGDPYAVLANQNARKAIAMAIDKQQLVDVILNDGSVPVNYFTPSKLAIDNEGKDYRDVAGDMGIAYNAEEAKKAWEAAKKEVGFDTVKIEFLTYDTETSKKSSEYIQSQLETNLPGIDVEIKQQPFKQKLDLETKGQFNMSYAGWGADYPDPLTFLETFVTDAQYAAKVDYSNAEFDKLIKAAKESTDVKESWAKYAEAEKMFLDEAFLIPIYQRGDSVVSREYVKDIVEHSYGADFTYKWASVEGKEALNLADSSDIPSMDVSKATDSVSFNVINNTMEGLTRVQKDGTIGPAMAESWEASEDQKTWTFKIRKGAKWSNGDTVTAKDFEYSWKRTLDPATASEYGYILYDIVGASDYNTGKTTDANAVGVKALDDNTLQVTLNRPVNYFDKLMAFQIFYPQNEKVIKAQGDKYGTTLESVVYNGPFTLTNWKLEDQYTMSKNANYWDASAVKLKTINTKIVKDINAVVNLYETNEIDRINRLSAEHVDKYKDSKEFHTKGMASTYFLLVKNGEKK